MTAPTGRLAELSHALKELRARLREGGGPERMERQHAQGKLSARERVDLLLDPGAPRVEIGLLVAHDRYEGQAPGAGVVTVVGHIEGRDAVVVANDATVAEGSWRPEAIAKMLRAQEIAMRCRIPIVYLVDSVGVDLSDPGGVFPGQYGAARLFFYGSVMRRWLRIPQFAAVMGPCIAGGAYLPALSDVILMVEGGPELVKAATGRSMDAEELGGARIHAEVSGVAHYVASDDAACLAHLRRLVGELPGELPQEERTTIPPRRTAWELYDLLPDDHRAPYDAHKVLECILDGEGLDEFQSGHAREMICGTGRVDGIPVGVIANARGMFKDPKGGSPRFGGLIYPESARKAAHFIETMDRHRTPLLFVQDVSGLMVGPEAEHAGMVRAGAELVEAVATATVPKLVLTLNHATGAGYHAMAAQGFDPDFILSLPTGRMGVMEGEAAVMALFSAPLERLKTEGKEPDADLRERMDAVRSEYERQLDARFAGARGFVDEVVLPEEVRPALGLLLRASLHNPGPHLGAFQLPEGGMPAFSGRTRGT